MKAGIFAAVLALAVALLQMLLLQNRQEATGSEAADNKQASVPQVMTDGHHYSSGFDQYDFSVALYPSERFGSLGRGGSYLEQGLHR